MESLPVSSLHQMRPPFVFAHRSLVTPHPICSSQAPAAPASAPGTGLGPARLAHPRPGAAASRTSIAPATTSTPPSASSTASPTLAAHPCPAAPPSTPPPANTPSTPPDTTSGTPATNSATSGRNSPATSPAPPTSLSPTPTDSATAKSFSSFARISTTTQRSHGRRPRRGHDPSRLPHRRKPP